jgi:hypothetical protein
MQLPDKAVIQFRQIWKEQFGEDLPIDTARANAERLLSLFKFAASEPLPLTQKDKDPP